MSDQQADWDLEYQTEFAARVRRLAAAARDRRKEEAAAAKLAQQATARWQQAQADVERHVRSAPTEDAAGWHRRLHELAAAEDAAEAGRLEARQKAVQARERRQKAQAELRAAIRADRQPCPLFERPAAQATLGHGQADGETTEVRGAVPGEPEREPGGPGGGVQPQARRRHRSREPEKT